MQRRHLFHILSLSPWPLFVGLGAFFFLSSLTFNIHGIFALNIPMILALIIIIKSCFSWVYDIIDEATCAGDHTIGVQMGITSGFLLFIISEIMLFFGFFWAFFHSSLCPSILIGGEFPPVGITVIPPFTCPLYNTCLLLLSGITVTWLHKAIIIGNYRESIRSFLWTIFLGFSFFILQMMEYYASPFNFNSSVYAVVFLCSQVYMVFMYL